MSEFHIDYARVQKALRSVKSIDSEKLANNDELVRALTYLVDQIRRETRKQDFDLF